MTTFQIVLLIVFSIGAILALVGLIRGVFPFWIGIGTVALFGAAIGAAIWPQATTSIAKTLGIGRGVNLILYCTVVVMMAGFFMTYTRLRSLRREMTELVRQIAIADGERRLAARTQAENEAASSNPNSLDNEQSDA